MWGQVTTFINAHMGWLANDLERLGELLDEMPNVYTELGAVVAELGRQSRFARKFFIKYQNRLMMGKDSWNPAEYHTYFRVFETADEFFPYYRKRHAWWRLYGLDLPDEVLRKIYYKNALSIVPGLDTSLFPDDWNVEAVPAPGLRPSPMALARTWVKKDSDSKDSTYVKIHYSSPRKRGRVIFGELVPNGQLWRTAANEASEVTLTGNLRVGDGKKLKAGSYSLFSIPGEDSWTVIFNRRLGAERHRQLRRCQRRSAHRRALDGDGHDSGSLPYQFRRHRRWCMIGQRTNARGTPHCVGSHVWRCRTLSPTRSTSNASRIHNTPIAG
jgi:hypothetical protein